MTNGHEKSGPAVVAAKQANKAGKPAADCVGIRNSIPHDLVERAVAHHTDLAWVRLYIGRWLRAPVECPDGTLVERTKGTPQGGVVSPLLANLFLHYAFDRWMDRNYPNVRFERYADDAIVHCRSEEEARSVLEAIRGRFAECGLELHPEKTRIVYCKDGDRPRRSGRPFASGEWRPPGTTSVWRTWLA